MEGKETVNSAGAEWGLFKSESKGPTGELICQWNGKGGSATDVQQKARRHHSHSHSSAYAEDSGSKHCCKQPLQGFEQT